MIKCKQCDYYTPTSGKNEIAGECWLMPPQMAVLEISDGYGEWRKTALWRRPPVTEGSGCGQGKMTVPVRSKK